MKIKVLTLKAWCIKNISPLAWQRVVLNVLPQLRDRGFELEELENPHEDSYFKDEEFKLFTLALNNLYKITFPKEVLERIQ